MGRLLYNKIYFTFSVSGAQIEIALYFLGAYGVDEGGLIHFLDGGDELSRVGGADYGIYDHLVVVLVRSQTVHEGGSVLGDIIDEIAYLCGFVGDDKERILLVGAIQDPKDLR